MAKFYTRRRKTTKRRQAKVSAPRVRKIVLSMNEKKYKEGSFSMAVGTSWMFMSLLAGATGDPAAVTWTTTPFRIGQGNDANTRIGNKIFLHAVRLSFVITPSGNNHGNLDGDTCRCILYHNKEAAGIQVPSSSSVFSTQTIDSPRYIPLKTRYTIVKDALHTFVPIATDQGGASTTFTLAPVGSYAFTIYPKKKIEYTSTTGALSEIFKDDYGLGCIARKGYCTMTCQVQLIYSDM